MKAQLEIKTTLKERLYHRSKNIRTIIGHTKIDLFSTCPIIAPQNNFKRPKTEQDQNKLFLE